MEIAKTKFRIESIDVLRGIVMLVMAIDHVRDYFHVAANTDNPLNLATTTPMLFFTRWITHFCAPVFVFLSGMSIYLQSLRKSKKELSGFLIKRGIWLILAEVILVSFAWSYNPAYNFLFLQVIWVIGLSMIILGLFIFLPFNVILYTGLIIFFGHNLLDIPESKPDFQPTFWTDIVHSARFSLHPLFLNHSAFIVYPFLAWTGLMFLGYCMGKWFTSAVSFETRKKYLITAGITLVLIFIVLRYSNVYGDPGDWSSQKNNFYSFLSFLNTNKYPPSLLYLCMTIGPSLIILALIEKTRNSFTKMMSIFGRTAFFYYIIHLYLIHLLSVIAFFIRGHSFSEANIVGSNYPFFFVIPGEGYDLPVVYAVTVAVIALLYPLCKWYDKYKMNHREKWWLSYL